MSDGGKGSAQRPSTVAPEKFAENYTAIFGLSKLEKLRLAEQAKQTEAQSTENSDL